MMYGPRKDLLAHMVKNLPAMRETRFDPWVRKIPWRRACKHSSILAWRISWTVEPGGLQGWDVTERLTAASRGRGPAGTPAAPDMGAAVRTLPGALPPRPLPSWAPCTLSSGCHLPHAEEPAILRTPGARPRRRGARRAL